MFVEGGWRPSSEPSPQRRSRDGQDRTITWLIVGISLLMLLAPIGGATIVQAVLAMAGSG